MDLVTCRHCGAPNHPARPACGRCRESLPRPGAPVFAEAAEVATDTSDGEVAPEAAAAPRRAGGTPADAAVAEDADADADATAAHAPVTAGLPAALTGQGQDATVATATVEVGRSDRTVGAKVLDLLRGPDLSDTQPLDATATAARVEVPRESLLPRRSVLLISAFGLGLGAVVGIAAAAGRLPFGEGDAQDGPAFDPGVYRREPVVLDVADVRATSYLAPTGTNSYEPELVLDDDLATAWNSDGAGRADGVGERFTLRLAAPAWITALEFANGYQKDDVRFLANARIARATVDFDRGQQVNLVLIDQGGWQRVPLPEPILASSFDLEVLDVFRGDTYRDLGLSGLRVLGHPALGVDREAATREQG